MENTAAHELMLLALDPNQGGRRHAQPLSYAVPVVLAAELALQGRIRLDDGRLSVVPGNSRELGPAMRHVLQAADKCQGKRPTAAVRKLRSGADLAVLDELISSSQVRRGSRTVLGLFQADAQKVADSGRVRRLAQELARQLDHGVADQRALLLAWGLQIARLERQVLGQDYRQLRRAAMDMSARGGLPADAVALLKGGLRARQAMESAAAS
ncbi:GOLPH3/VPS74 family protein [Luteococcus sp. OSA5]|uniref:GOLPH3/VPS74 family protein n=1 Tax=Luteococcus sp. OSA5 TaxID=3401630 RepID=UPI003B4356AB